MMMLIMFPKMDVLHANLNVNHNVLHAIMEFVTYVQLDGNLLIHFNVSQFVGI